MHTKLQYFRRHATTNAARGNLRMNPRMHPVDDFSHGLFKICVSNVGSAGGTCTKDVLLAGVKVDSLLFEIWNKKVIHR